MHAHTNHTETRMTASRINIRMIWRKEGGGERWVEGACDLFLWYNGNHQWVEMCNKSTAPLRRRGSRPWLETRPHFFLVLLLLFLLQFSFLVESSSFLLKKKPEWKKTWSRYISLSFMFLETEIGFRRYPVLLHWTSESRSRATSDTFLSICSPNICSCLVQITFLYFFSSLHWSSLCNSIPPLCFLPFNWQNRNTFVFLTFKLWATTA